MASRGKQGAQKAKNTASPSTTASNDASGATSNSACVIIPPLELWDAIQEIRSANDTSFDRWPPHVNLLWPFLPQTDFSAAAASIEGSAKFKALQPFRVRLSTFSFTQGSRYVHLIADCLDENGNVLPWPPVISKGRKKEATSTPMQDLFSSLISLFPGCERPFLDATGAPTEYFLPHLSVGQVDQPTIRDTVQRLQANWTPIEFEVTELTFLARNGPNKAFQTILTVPLGS